MGAVLSLVAPALALSADDLEVGYAPVWPGVIAVRGFTPVAVTVSNKGPDTVGVLKVTGRRSLYGVPLELPKGARKEVVVYIASLQPWSEGTLRLETSAGAVDTPIELKTENPSNAATVGVVSQTEGLLSWMRLAEGRRKPVWSSTCKPETAPGRSVGYDGLRAVVVYEGAERLSDLAVQALKTWVMRGGTLVIPGGPAAPWARDPRWSDVLPVEPGEAAVAAQTASLAELGGAPLSGPLAVMSSRAKPGTDTIASSGSVPLVVESRCGLGKIVFLAFDPFSNALRTWPGWRKIVTGYALEADNGRVFVSSLSEVDQLDRWGRPMATGTAVDRTDPFEARLPETWKIVGILMSFLFVAVPMNFFALGKAGKKELAWATLPLTSLFFSAAIFATAGNLYSATTSRSAEGLLIVQDGVGFAVFEGRQQVFFPRAGGYDLGFHNVEAVKTFESQTRVFGGGTIAETPDVFDLGQMVAPKVEVSNLTFRQYGLTELVPAGWRLSLDVSQQSSDEKTLVKGTLKNNGPLRLREAKLWLDGSWCDVPDVAPGDTVAVDATFEKRPSRRWREGPLPPISDHLALTARVDDAPVGSSLGKPSKRQNVTLYYGWRSTGP